MVDALEGQDKLDRPTIIKILSKFRYLFQDLSYGEDAVMQKITNYLPSNHMVFPCDVIDLRKILIDEEIKFDDYIPLFSKRFAESFLKRYALFLVIDIRKIDKDSFKYGGLCILRDNELDISDSLIRIVVNKQAANNTFNVVQNMMQELNKYVECVVENSVPGMSSPAPILSSRKIVFKAAQNVESELSLDPKEKNIFDFLRRVKKDYNLPVQMRVAGGWVRDKLLGKESDDIDIAVNMPGYDFAKIVADAAVKYNVTHDPKAYKVSLEKSKDPSEKTPNDSLLVGAVYLFGQKIEFVPMRTEHYPDPDSRQPEITNTNDPREDVKRRDLTINSLYYNVDTGKVEDYVGGRKDLGVDGNGTILLRTPDDAYKTFHEDPLRLLRVLRFHSRYPNSVIDPSVVEAMKNPEVQASYARKVSTERAGPELIKMLSGANPVDSLRLLFESGLYKQVFDVPSMKNINEEGIMMDQRSPYHEKSLSDHTLDVVKYLNEKMSNEGESDLMRGLMNFAAMFHDFGKMSNKVARPHKNPRFEGHTTYVGHENESETMAEEIMNSIGLKDYQKKIVKAVVKSHMFPHKFTGWADSWAKKKKIWKGNEGPGKFMENLKLKGLDQKTRGLEEDDEEVIDKSADLWKYVHYHAEADSKAGKTGKHDEGETERGRQWFENYYNDPAIEFTRTRGSVIDGNTIKNLVEEISGLEQQKRDPTRTKLKVEITPNVISFVQKRIADMQYRRLIPLDFAAMEEGPEKESSLINSQNRAANQARQIIKSNLDKYLKITPIEGETTMSTSWYDKIKTSNTISKPLPVPQEEDPEVHKGPQPMEAKYQKGMRVRDRRKGLVVPQDFGVVYSINNNTNIMIILWNPDNKEKKREEKFDMVEDTEKLSLIVAEV